MKQTQFGIAQLKNPTPKWAKNTFRGVLFLAVIWTFLAPNVPELSPATVDTINLWSLRSVGIIRIAISFFGLDYKENS